MKFGMNLFLWTAHPTVAEHASLIRQIRDWGFDGVEFPVGMCTDAEIHELAKLSDDLGLARTALQGLNAQIADSASPDPKLRAAAVDEIKRGVDRAVLLGTNLLSGPFFQGQGQKTLEPPTRDEWNWSVDVVRQAAEYAQSCGVRLALEPLYRFEMRLVNTVGDAARYCRDVGLSNVGLLVDTHHSNIEEEQPADAWRAVGPHIFHVHISENNRGVPGRGHACGVEMFRALRDVGYDEWLTIEAFSPNVAPLVPRLRLWRSFCEREEEVPVEGLAYVRACWERAKA